MLQCRLSIRLKPGAKNDRVSISETGTIDIAVTSRPIEGKANEHLVRLLAKKLDVAKSMITIMIGGHSKNKVMEINGLTQEEVMKRLEGNL